MGKRKKGKSNFKGKLKVKSKKQQAKIANMQQFFGTLCERFSSTYINSGMDPENEDVLKKFDEINVQWKERARIYITANIDMYPKTPQRQRYIATFERFVEALIKKYEDVDNSGEKVGEGIEGEMIEVPGDTLTVTAEDLGLVDIGQDIPPQGGGAIPEDVVEAIFDEDMKSDEEKDMGRDDSEDDVNDWSDYHVDMIKEALDVANVRTRARTIKGLKPVVEALDEYQLRIFKGELGLL